MKQLIVFLLFFYGSLFSYDKNIIKNTVRAAAEEIITKSGFSLLSEEVQNEALNEQAAQTEDGDCIDDTCLMDTGKMLAAQRLFLIKISDLGGGNYMFKIIHMNLETNETVSVRSEIYGDDLNDTKKLFAFSKKFLSYMKKELKNKREDKIPVMLELVFEGKQNSDVRKHVLTLTTKYDPVNVYEGNKFWGITPLKIQISEGIHSFVFEKLGYEPLNMKIKVIRDLKVTHIPFKKAVILTIKSKIRDAHVFVDRADAGDLEDGKLKLTLKDGEYEITLKKEGYESKTMNIKLKDYIKKALDFGELYKKGGPYPVKINTKITSKVYLDGKFKGVTPIEIRLKEGKYKLMLYNEIAKSKEYEIVVKKPLRLYYSMDRGFNFFNAEVNFSYLISDFPWQKNDKHSFLGSEFKFFKWIWRYWEIDVFGINFYKSFGDGFLYKFHIFELGFKPVENLKLNISLGPFFGDFIDYENTPDLYRTYTGAKLSYFKDLNKYFYIFVNTSVYYGTKNSEHSYYSSNDNSMDKGWLFLSSLGIGIYY